MDFLACSCGCGGELHAYELSPTPLIVLRPVAITPPGAEPVSLALGKLHVRVTNTTEDELIGQYITAARLALEAYCERSLVRQGWEALVGGIASSSTAVELPMGPVESVDQVERVDPDGTRTALTGWAASGRFVAAPPEGWPAAPAAVAITYTAGDDAAPAPIVQAILLLLGLYYDNRAPTRMGSIVTPIPYTVEWLVGPYRATTGLVA